MIPKGAYLNGLSYKRLDVVGYGGQPWLCRKACYNVIPEEGEYWMSLVDKLTFDDLTESQKQDLAQGAIEAAELAKSYAEAVKEALESAIGGEDPAASTIAQVTKNTADISKLSTETNESIARLQDAINSLNLDASLPDNIIETNDDGFFLLDENLNIGAKFDKNGPVGFGGSESLAGLTYKVI